MCVCVYACMYVCNMHEKQKQKKQKNSTAIIPYDDGKTGRRIPVSRLVKSWRFSEASLFRLWRAPSWDAHAPNLGMPLA